MRALITGADGLLGRHLRAVLPNSIPCGHQALDITDEDSVWRAVTSRQVDAVFHCAAMTDVDACERDPARARRVNAVGSRHVASVCGSLGIFMVALSTDYVFDGKRGESITEETAPKPLSVYGKTKLEGEIAVRELCPSHAIVRTSWLYGHGGQSFVTRVINRGIAAEDMDIVDSQDSSPTWVHDLAPALIELVKHRATGTFHLTNEGNTTRDQRARAILETSGFSTDLVHSVDKFPAAARRPHYSGLQNVRARAQGIRLRPWRDALDAYLNSDSEIQGLLAEARETVA